MAFFDAVLFHDGRGSLAARPRRCGNGKEHRQSRERGQRGKQRAAADSGEGRFRIHMVGLFLLSFDCFTVPADICQGFNSKALSSLRAVPKLPSWYTDAPTGENVNASNRSASISFK